MTTPYIIIPTFEDSVWTYTEFATKEEFRDFILPLFKEPGKYDFDETSYQFIAQAKIFQENLILYGDGYYCKSPQGTSDYKKYWDSEKEKCRFGAIYKNKGKVWYLTRDYYMWLNFLPIFDKEEGKIRTAKVRDAQYHMALYEILAELHHKHAAILKKRQIASSYFHAAKLINQLWFEEGVTLKMGASLKDYINDKGTWKFLDEYAAFLNKYTAWYRPLNPNKVMMWQQKIEKSYYTGGLKRTTETGLKGTIQGMSFEKSASNGVGGPCKYFFHEEGGIAPKADETFRYIKPAMRSGMIYTGMFIIAGSVGDLDDCKPLKEFMLDPDANDMYSVETNLIDGEGTLGRSGLFIPEQWSMPPFIDEFGNSKVQEALKALEEEFSRMKRDLSPESYQLEISQRPRNIEEAFAYRKQPIFPAHLVKAQKARVQDKHYAMEYLDISRDENGKPEFKTSNKLPIKDFPVSKKMDNKEGVLVVYERPVKDPEFGMYYASIDPVSEGKTTTSESLCSIFVYKNSLEITRIDGEVSETFIEPGKIVASWCGRFDDITKTHERLEMILEIYNAWGLIENNISLFILHMINKKKQKYLVPKSQILFLKDISANLNVYQEYGWRNTGTLFGSHLLSYGIEFIREEIDHETKEDGTIVKTTYGVERIPDEMLLTEMEQYTHGLNVDRLVAYCALVAFVKIQESNRGYKKIREVIDNKLDKSKKISNFNSGPFRHLGRKTTGASNKISRSAFKNLR